MFENYLKTTFRNFYLNKTQTIIKIIGLSIALCVSIAIFSWVKFELSYDNFHKDSDQIYRLVLEDNRIPAPPGFKLLFDEIPEIENSTRLFYAGFLGGTQKVSHGKKIFTNDAIYYADDDFFKVFSFPLLQGNPNNVLSKRNAAIITEATAAKYFGKENPVGKTLLLGNENLLEITGVLKKIPENSHFHFDILITMKNLEWWNTINNKPIFGSMWVFPTYFKINKNTNIETVKQKIARGLHSFKNTPDSFNAQEIADIHLHSNYTMELEANGDINSIYLFSAVGILIIFMSCINYINLSTALSFKRSKEVGIRKTVGALRHQIIFQFVNESVLTSVIAFLIAMILVEAIKPFLFSIIGVKFFNGIFGEEFIVLITFIFTLFLGFLTGLFPALTVEKRHIISSVNSVVSANGKAIRSRGTLVIIQFCISIILITSSIIIYNQMNFIKNKKLGYNKNQVLVLNLGQNRIIEKIDVLKKSFSENPNIINITSCSQLPTNIITAEGVIKKDGTRYEPYFIGVDKDFFQTLDIKIKKGKEQIGNMFPDYKFDWKSFKNNFVVNQTFLNKAGIKIEDTENQPLSIRHGNMNPGPIIGVVDDFHFESLHSQINALVFEFTPALQWNNAFLLVKINQNNISSTINFIKNKWESLADGLPFEFSFLDEEYNSLYKSEAQMSNLFLSFTLISVFIIVLGLLGLIAFITNQKTKEIGIRKVLGASINNILLLLSKKIIAWVIIANVTAIPFSYYLMNKWLQDFAYRIDIGWWMFALSGGAALLIALAKVSFQAVKAALANPVDSLKYE